MNGKSNQINLTVAAFEVSEQFMIFNQQLTKQLNDMFVLNKKVPITNLFRVENGEYIPILRPLRQLLNDIGYFGFFR